MNIQFQDARLHTLSSLEQGQQCCVVCCFYYIPTL